MGRVMIIGAGGVGRVVTYKCAQHPEIFSELLLASRTVSKCEKIAADVRRDTGYKAIRTAAVDAENVPELVRLIETFNPRLVIHVALPYQDLTIMEACLQTGTDYLDTANYETQRRGQICLSLAVGLSRAVLQKKELWRLLGCGFDPGVTGVFTAYAAKHHFDEIHYLDIVDCNDGDHGKAFATNFNPEINIREITQKGKILRKTEHGSKPSLMKFPPC